MDRIVKGYTFDAIVEYLKNTYSVIANTKLVLVLGNGKAEYTVFDNDTILCHSTGMTTTKEGEL